MMMHFDYFESFAKADLSAKGIRIWFRLLSLVTRGNLVLGATPQRLATVSDSTPRTVLKAIEQLAAAKLLRYEPELCVIRLNPHWFWDGTRDGEDDDQFYEAVNEWEGWKVDRDKRMERQLQHFFSEERKLA